MGQQNQKIHIENIYDQTNLQDRKRDKLRRIFNKGRYAKDSDNPAFCDRPNCSCPNKHIVRENLKLCDSCNNTNAPTIYKNKKMSYSTAPMMREQQTPNGF